VLLNQPSQSTQAPNSLQLRQLAEFGRRINKFGANLAVFDCGGQMLLLCEGDAFKSDRKKLESSAAAALNQDGEIRQRCNENGILTSFLNADNKKTAIVMIDAGGGAADDDKQTDIDSHNHLKLDLFGEMLGLLIDRFEADTKAQKQIEVISTELSQVYEELVLLHKLSMNMRITEPDANFLQMACDSLTDIVSVEGIAVLLERDIDGQKDLVLSAGSGLIDINDHMVSVLRSRLGDELNNKKEALLDSEVDGPFRFLWPETIKNIIAVPLFGKEKTNVHLKQTAREQARIIGLMVAINRIDKPDFDSTDVKLFNSVASGCAVFVENGRLFNDLKELFIGSLKALTRSIDAKDRYTRGHSERVAFISRWIAERLAEHQPLNEQLIQRVYLAGLLHDIGKVGVDELVLRKKDRLTEDEFDYIKKHPAIGAAILGQIKQMSDIVPGVLSHHERIDGTGYPNGLAGEQIPMIARIIGIADSFDAMTSKRTYRDAMSVRQALAEIERSLGTQFDEKIGKIFINSDVYRLWDIMQDGFTGSYGQDNFSEYGTVAVGALVK